MEKIEQKLEEIRDLLKANAMPSPNPPMKIKEIKPLTPVSQLKTTAPVQPAAPTLAPTSKKNPLKVAQQIQDKPIKQEAVKQAKETLKVAKNGQWSLK